MVLYDDEDKTEDKNKVLDTEDNSETQQDENEINLLSVGSKPDKDNDEQSDEEHTLFNNENTNT